MRVEIETKEKTLVQASEMRLGDIVRPNDMPNGSFWEHQVIAVRKDGVTLFRPYARPYAPDLNSTINRKKMTPYVGFETYDVSFDDREWNLIWRMKRDDE